MGSYERKNAMVKVLAYLHRYAYPVLILTLPACLGDSKGEYSLWLGVGCLALAVYDLVGYKLRWRHIYCSRQDANHQRMTPNRTIWSEMKAADIYGIPLLLGALGIAMVVIGIRELG